jgi:hypothetical protein
VSHIKKPQQQLSFVNQQRIKEETDQVLKQRISKNVQGKYQGALGYHPCRPGCALSVTHLLEDATVRIVTLGFASIVTVSLGYLDV